MIESSDRLPRRGDSAELELDGELDALSYLR
jgi:hypothetical protein